MLIEFKAKNYKSIRDEIKVSFLVEEKNKNSKHFSNLIPFKPERNWYLLKSALIAGPNASGKSNVLEIISFIVILVLRSKGFEGSIDGHPYIFVNDKKNHSEFEITFEKNETIYRYGFWLHNGKVLKEYLEKSDFLKKNGKNSRLTFSTVFNKEINSERNINIIDYILEATDDNRLYLSVGGSTFRNKDVREAFEWFFDKINFLNPEIKKMNNNEVETYTFSKYLTNNDEEYLDKVKNILRSIDVGIHDMTIKKVMVNKLNEENSSKFPKEITEEEDFIHLSVSTTHKVNNKEFILPFAQESQGTKTLVGLAGMLVDAIDNNYCLVVDEFDNSLHPELCRELLNFFNDKSKKAQLLFSTHDVTLLDLEIFRKDQIFFTEKDFDEQYTKLHCLAEYKGVRDTDDIVKKYMKGRFGAFPYLPNISMED